MLEQGLGLGRQDRVNWFFCIMSSVLSRYCEEEKLDME